MKERILALRKALHLKQGEFAARLGMKGTALSMIEVGDNSLTEKNIRLICMSFNVNEEWLRNGKGEMFTASPYEGEFAKIYHNLLPDSQQDLLKLAKKLLASQNRTSGAEKAKNQQIMTMLQLRVLITVVFPVIHPQTQYQLQVLM
jgi:transcriptional regulator with XRE-family HTH domain